MRGILVVRRRHGVNESSFISLVCAQEPPQICRVSENAQKLQSSRPDPVQDKDCPQLRSLKGHYLSAVTSTLASLAARTTATTAPP